MAISQNPLRAFARRGPPLKLIATSGIAVGALVLATSTASGSESASPARPPTHSSANVTPEEAATSVNESSAVPEGEQQAQALYHEGERRYSEGNYPAAVRAFRRAYELSPRPELVFNVANALERWGYYSEAARQLERYAASVDGEAHSAVQKRISVLRTRRPGIHPGADACPGAPPQPTAPQANSEDVPVTSPSTAEGASLPSLASVSGAPVEELRPRVSGETVVGYSLLTVGALGLGTGLVFGLSSARDTQRLEDRCLSSGVCPSSASDELDNSRARALAADLSLGAGLLAVGAGLFLLWGDDDAEASPTVSAGAAPGGAGFQVRGVF